MLKKALLTLVVAALGATPFIIASHVAAAPGPNLIANGSFEASTNSLPDSWLKNAWGTNAATFAYVTNDGHTGTHSATVTMTSHTDGDAKWYANPVVLESGKQYTYSDYYKATASTELVAQFEDTAGNFSYQWLKGPAAASAWTQATATFTAPANVKNATIFHLIANVGTLQIDDAYLGLTDDGTTPTPTPTPVTGNLVQNPSAETADPAAANKPANWTTAGWGTNTRSFTWAQTGHTGSHSLKLSVSNYTDGTANWAFPSQPVTAGQTYQYGDWFKSTMPTEVDVMLTMQDGSTQFLYLGTAQTSSGWLHFWRTFTMPSGVASATVLHIVYSAGTLSIDDVVFGAYKPTGFNRALVSLTFDDAWKSTHDNGLPVLTKYGYKSTQYLLTGMTSDPDYMTVANMKDFKNAGHEIASHTVDHPDLTTVTTTKLTSELGNSKNWLKNKLGVTATDFATPYGAYNSTVLTNIKKYYSSHRSVEAGYNSKDNFDIYDIRVQNITNQTAAADVANWVAQAQADKTWLVLVYHQVAATQADAAEYDTWTANLDAQLAAIKAANVPVVTVQQALTELAPQL